MYQDYAISPTLFHWKSQSTTSAASKTGQRYLTHRVAGSEILIFSRAAKLDALGTMAYTFLGTADYVSHTGDRPIGITWKLSRPMPPIYSPSARVAINRHGRSVEPCDRRMAPGLRTSTPRALLPMIPAIGQNEPVAGVVDDSFQNRVRREAMTWLTVRTNDGLDSISTATWTTSPSTMSPSGSRIANREFANLLVGLRP